MRRCDDNGLITVYTVIAGLLCVYYYCTQLIIDALYPGISFVLCFRVVVFSFTYVPDLSKSIFWIKSTE